MVLECVKYREMMKPEDAYCRHPTDYCKYRSSCIIHFMGKEKGSETDTGADDVTVSGTATEENQPDDRT